MLFSKLLPLLLCLVGHCSAQSSTLDGYAFDCGGILFGFEGTDQVVCLNGSEANCGNYIYNEATQVLTGYTSLTGSFLAFSMEIQDGNLISFQSDLGKACHAVSLDWPKYSTVQYLGLKCPAQNEVPNLAYETNHFSFGVSGDVALRSPLEFSSGRRLVRDSYGIYTYGDDESLHIYFGPQQGQPLTVIKGRLTHGGELFLQDYVPPGPCVHDGESAILNVTQLPQQKSIISQDHMIEEGIPYSASVTERAIYWVLLGTSFFGLSALSC